MHDKDAAGEATDPVCGMKVNTTRSAGTSEHAGQKYYFCSAGCKKTFDQDPARYAGGAKPGRGG
ncbi:MAG TPA: YHS domain-containing protein [Gemmatimonadaceae bacterium]|nr:YHS domain-containing protein [Gemmatimonadaceae bacterium]